MLKRRIIRTLFILPVLLCLAAWAWSTRHQAIVTREFTQMFFSCHLDSGAIAIIPVGQPGPPSSWGLEFQEHPFCLLATDLRPCFSHSHCTLLGFDYQHGYSAYDSLDGPMRPYWILSIPLWFPLFIGLLMLAFAWRKTAHRKPPQGFPIELGAKDA